MMRNKFKAAAALIAGAALMFSVAGCDTGDNDYIVEVPTTYYSYADSGNASTVTAAWDFDTNVWSSIVTTTEAVIPADTAFANTNTGTGATLVAGTTCSIKYVADTDSTRTAAGFSGYFQG